MRKYVVVASALVATGVGVSFLLIPNEGDVAVMQAKDVQTINTGNLDLEAEYNQGRRSFPIMSALADKKIAAGDRPGAIKVLEEYVASNGADAKGHQNWPNNISLPDVRPITTASLRPWPPAPPPRRICACFPIFITRTKTTQNKRQRCKSWSMSLRAPNPNRMLI